MASVQEGAVDSIIQVLKLEELDESKRLDLYVVLGQELLQHSKEGKKYPLDQLAFINRELEKALQWVQEKGIDQKMK